ncbi:hypothetical protein L7F22_067568 [Adiantum nelumboides]|nr:hypothetical protein [Adiantum nelumboides]
MKIVGEEVDTIIEGRNIQPVHLPLLCDTENIAEKLYDLNNKDRFGDMDPARALDGAQLIWADFPIGATVSHTSPLVPTWNDTRLDLIEAATTLAEAYLLDNGTFVATLRGKNLSDVVNVFGDASFALKLVLYLDIYGEVWRFDDDSDPEIDPKLLCDDDFSDEEWSRVWLYKRHQKDKMHLKGLRPEMYEECLLLYHKVYQGAPPNNEIGLDFAHGFTWQKCQDAEDSEGLVAWAVYAEGQAKEEFLKKRAFGLMETFGMSNVSSITFSASTVDVAAISNMKTNAVEKLKEKQQCLKAIKIALDQSKTKRDEQVGLMRGAAKIIERLNKDMEELKLHKAGLVPNKEAMAKFETLIQIRKEALKDMGLDIEVHNLDNLGVEAAQLQGQHDTLLWEVEVATAHLRFVEMIINLFKSRMPILPVRPPVHLGSDNSCVQLGDCVACGMSIMLIVITSVYMLRCQHRYHPLCFVTAYKSAGQCLFHGCEEPLKDALKLLAPEEANMDEHVGTAHSQAGSLRKPNIDSMCGGCEDKNAFQKQAGEDTPNKQKAKKRTEKRVDVVGTQGDASKESAEVPLKP